MPTTDRSKDDVELLERASVAARDGQVEIDDELDHALDELEGNDMSPAEQKHLVDELIARKEKEREIEKRFNVNLTNDNDDGEIDVTNKDKMPRPRASWSIEELEQMQVVLDRMPAHAIEENARLGEIRRSVADYDYDPTTETWVEKLSRGETTLNQIQIFDEAVNGANDHDGDSSDLAGIHEITSLQETVAHEVGHVLVHTKQVDSDLVTDKANWRSERTSPDIERKLEESKTSKTGVASDGRTYVMDESGNITSADAALMPRSNEHTDGNEKGDSDTWSYARSAEGEYFAEMHAKAIIAPELLYKDLIDGPRQRLQELEDRRAPQAEIDEAKRIADSMAEQHAAMRTKVMKVDPQVEEANIEALKARADQLGLDDIANEMLVEDYKKEAAKAMTPEQLEVVFNTYDGDIESYY